MNARIWLAAICLVAAVATGVIVLLAASVM